MYDFIKQHGYSLFWLIGMRYCVVISNLKAIINHYITKHNNSI